MQAVTKPENQQMEWADDFTPQQFHDYLSGLERIGQETNWRIGEAIIKQEAKWGTAYEIAEKATGYTNQRLRQIVVVCNAFQLFNRLNNSRLKWTHYEIASRIQDQNKRDRLLGVAQTKGLTTKEFLDEIASGSKSPQVEERSARGGFTLRSLTMRIQQAFGKQPKLPEWREEFLISEEYGIRPSIKIHFDLVSEIKRRGLEPLPAIDI